MNLINLIGKVVGMMLPKKTIEDRLKIQTAVSQKMERAIALWSDMYIDLPPWKGEKGLDTRTMNLASAISEEFARLITEESSITVTGSERADYINKQIERGLKNFPTKVEWYCSKGGIAVKPNIQGDTVVLNFYTADRFYPTAYDADGDISAAVFVEQLRKGEHVYTRLEYHCMNYNAKSTDSEERTNIYVVKNYAYRSERIISYKSDEDFNLLNCQFPLLEPINLQDVGEWSDLEPEATLADLERPLFAYIKVPRANNVDPGSPLGVSVYSRAVDTIREADRQYTRCIIEYELKEAAIHASQDLFKTNKRGEAILPEGKERLYRVLDDSEETSTLKDFSPAIRDTSFFNGLNKLLQDIEFLVGLAKGTLSEVQETAKTATEIKMSKQRAYSTVNGMQKEWGDGLEHIAYIVDTLATLYDLCPAGKYEVCCSWGDGVLEDTDVEYQRRWSMVLAGKLRVEKFLAWYFSCSEEDAKKNYMPPDDSSFTDDDGGA